MPAYDLNYHTYTSTGSNPDHIYARSQNEFKHTINAYTTYNLDLLNDHNFKLMAGLNRVTDDGSYNWTMRPELLEINNPQFDLATGRSEEHTSELQSRGHLVCRLLLE